MSETKVGRIGPKATAEGRNAVCSSAHPLVTDAMLDILREGGNAIDAAIVGCLLNATIQQDMTCHAGTVTMLFWNAEQGRCHELNSMGTIVPGLAPFRPVAVSSGPYTAIPEGPCAVIPGFMPGLKTMHERFGSRPWDRLCAPSIHWAEVGHEVDSFEHLVLGHSVELYMNTASGRRHFTPDGHLPQAGQRWPKPELARTLTKLAAEGPDLFIDGEWARLFVDRANEVGWPIEMRHMRQDEPRWGDGLRYRHGDVEVVQQAPPERQAVMSAMVLGILHELGVAELGHYAESPQSLYYMAHALRRAAYETGFINDPEVFEDPSSVLMSREYHRALAAVLRMSRTKVDLTEHVRLTSTPGALGEATGRSGESVGSCELSVVDAQGNWVQLVNTVQGGGVPGQVVGGVPMIGSTMTSSLTAMLGGWLTGGGRIRSVIGNTLLLRDGRPWLALGTPGIPHITVPQVMTSILENGLDPYAADDAPRMLPLADDYSVMVESRLTPEVVTEVARMGILVRPMAPYQYQMGSFHMTWRDDTGALHASAGPRRAGQAAAF